MKYNFSNFEYRKAHGKAPKGTGHWAFIIENATVDLQVPEVFHDKVSNFRTDTIFWVPGVWTLTEAKKRAAVILAAHAVPAGIEVEIAP